MKAHEILEAGLKHMTDRADTYDKPEGERSMAQTVAIFNLFHGTQLTEAQGWHLLQILKDVRLFTRPGYHADSAEDCVAYAALKAEAKSAEAVDRALEVAEKAAELLSECRAEVEKFIGAIDSGPMWNEWDGGHQPVLNGVVVEAVLRNGSCVRRVAEAFSWRHRGADWEVVRWREPWPGDERIDAIGQNGNDGIHYAEGQARKAESGCGNCGVSAGRAHESSCRADCA